MNTSVKKETLSPNNTDDSSLRSWAEPSPNWLEAIKEWNWLWEVHVYGFGTIFALIALFAVLYLIYSRKTTFSRHRVHLAVMNTALLIAGFFRALILFWDPYASSSDTTDLQLLVCIISWGISTACITSSFSIMLLIFLETTKISLGPARLKNLPCLVSITISNIVYLIISDLVVWFHPQAKVMIFICHVAFAIWGLTVSIGYLVAGIRMWRNLKSSLGEMFFNRALDRDARRLKRLFVLMCSMISSGVRRKKGFTKSDKSSSTVQPLKDLETTCFSLESFLPGILQVIKSARMTTDFFSFGFSGQLDDSTLVRLIVI